MRSLSQQEMSDRIEINDLLIRYTVAIDTKDWDLLDTCFIPDAHIDYTASGGVKGAYPEVREWLAKTLAMFTMTMHFISNTTVILDADAATTRTYMFNPMGSPRPDGKGLHIFTVGGYYNDKMARTPQGWRITERIEELAYFDGAPMPPPK